MDRKQEILGVALDIISQEGAKKLTMKNIAGRIGISEPAIYRHFQNKRHLMRALIESVASNLTGRINDAASGIEDPVDKLREILRLHLSYISDHRGIPRIIFSDSVHQNDPVLRKTVLQMVNHYLDLIRGILARARETGRLRPDLDVDTAAVAFLGLVQSSVLIWSLSDFDFPIHERAEALWEVFHHGLM
jgi:AcrR family transcriptional regulator